MDKTAAVNWLMRKKICTGPFGLHRMEYLMERLQYPHRSASCILVGGTNGKGSVTAILESILSSTGEYQIGSIISPHVLCLEERIRLNKKYITANLLTKGVETLVEPSVIMEREPSLGAPSFFELITALAFWAFRESLCDVNIIEVGLGGRLDATNVADPEISVITNIGTDHKEILGPTRKDIAREKLGIARKRRALITGEKDPEILNIFADECDKLKSTLVKVSEGDYYSVVDSHAKGHQIRLPDISQNVSFPLAGMHQLDNLNVALATVVQMRKNGFCISDQAMIDGISGVFWPGRLQWIDGTPPILLDGAHNSEGMSSLLGYLNKFPLPKPCHIILGTLQNKPAMEMATDLAPFGDSLSFVSPPCHRAIGKTGFEDCIKPTDKRWFWSETLGEALEMGRNSASILITGSLYLVSEFLTSGYQGKGS